MTASRSPRVVITGIGVVSPIGVGRDAFWQAIATGRDGFARAQRIATAELARQLVAQLPAPWQRRIAAELARDTPRDPCGLVAAHAAREAWSHAGLTAPAGRTAVIVGTASGGICTRSLYEATPVEAHARRHQLLAESRA